jgi:hypothetical protein
LRGRGPGRVLLRVSLTPVIVNRLRIFALATILLSAVGCSTPGIHPPDAVFDELMRKSGLWIQLAQVEPMMQAGVSQAHANAPKLSEEDLARLQHAIAMAYAADALRTSVRDQLAATLSPQDAASVLRWLSSDLGQRITVLEESGSTPEEAIKRLNAAPRLLASLPASRRERVERLAKATYSADAAATIIVDTMIGVARGLALSRPGAPTNGGEDLKSKFRSQRAQFVEMLEPRIVADFASIYQPLSDQELDQYVAFCESPAGHRFAQASLDALDKALTEAATRLGERLADVSARLRMRVVGATAG